MGGRATCAGLAGEVAGLGTAVAWIERLLRVLDRFQQRHTVLGFPFGVAKKFGDDQAGKHAALLAYYGFLSLFPLLLVFVTVLGYTLADNQELQQQVIDTLVGQFPVMGTQIKDSITTIQGSGIGLVVGILGTLWGGLGITQSAQDAMNAVWNIPRRLRPNYWLRLARGLGSLLLVATAVVGATALAQLGRIQPGILGRLPFVGSLLVNLLLLLVLFQVLTGMWVPWRRLLPGAVCGAVGWSTLQTLGVPDRRPAAAGGEPHLRGLRRGARAAVVDVPECPAAAVRRRDQRGADQAAVAAEPAPATPHRARSTGAHRAGRDRGAATRADRRGAVLGRGRTTPRGRRRWAWRDVWPLSG